MVTTNERSRLHALDAVRAVALLLGIFLHASLSFIPGISTEVWPISDVQKSTSLSLASFLIHLFRMAAFFFVAGFLARVLYRREGLGGFVRNRAARIAGPLVVGWVVCFVLIVGVVVWTLARANGGEWPTPSSLAAMRKAPPNLMHLWFLYLLIWLYTITVAARGALHWLDPHQSLALRLDALLQGATSSRTGALLLSIPIVVALFLIPAWDRAAGVPTPSYTLVPPPAPLFIYAYVFALGWMFDRQRSLLQALARGWRVHVALGAVGALVCLHLLAPGASHSAYPDAPGKLLYATAYGVALMSWTLALVGMGVKYLSGSHAVVRYLADASYWMYVMHLPLVMALQAALMLSDLHWAIKFLAINGLACLLLLVTYHYGVRSTWIGLFLNGRKVARS